MREIEHDWPTEGIHSSDTEYGRSIEVLCRVSGELEPPGLRRLSRILGVLAALCLVLAAVVWWQLLRDARRDNATRPAASPQINHPAPSSAAGHVP